MDKLRDRIFFGILFLLISIFLLSSTACAEYEGDWTGSTNQGRDVSFSVSSNSVKDFTIEMYVCGDGCATTTTTISPIPISGANFSVTTGTLDIAGSFTSAATCSGTWNFHQPYPALYGNGTWTATLVGVQEPILSVTPAFRDVPSSAGSTTFEVTNTGAGTMSWTAAKGSGDIWINITGGSSGTNTGTISVSYGQNTGNARVGTITITAPGAYVSPQTVQIRQKACNPYVEHKLTASDGAESDLFGHSVSISGDYAIVGADGDDDNGSGSGSAYIYKQIGTEWVQQAKLTASDGATFDNFGNSVSISGDYAIVGAVNDDGNDTDSGSAYVFKKPAEGWTNMTQTAKLTANDGSALDNFGISVSISGEYAIVGAYYDNSFSGSAYIFKRIGSEWVQQAKLTASDGATFDNFGNSVSISGDYAIVGAINDDGNGTDSGSAYIFKKPADGWINMTETAKLTASDGSAIDHFGSSVSISGDYAMVGAYNDGATGTAYIFKKPTEGWTNMAQTAKLTASDGAAFDCFGYSVSISGDYAIVGAYKNGAFGSSYIFKKPAGGWINMTETAKLTASDGAGSDYFGYSVGISGDYAIVGAYNDDDNGSNSGTAYIYWVNEESVDEENTEKYKGDFNGDGNRDILWRNKQTGQVNVWLTNPAGTGVLSKGTFGAVADMNWEIIDVGNFNAATDIKADIIWRNKQTGQVNVWLINGTAVLSKGTLGTVSDLNWEIIKTGDFNADSNTDILWRNKQTGQVNVWLTNPSGIGILSKGALCTVSDMNWEIIEVGNFNTAIDTKTDILWSNMQTGQVNVWLMDGTALLSKGTLGTVSNLSWEIVNTGNFNFGTDNNTDLLWRNKQTGQVNVWLTNPASIGILSKGALGTVSDLNWEIVSAGNFNSGTDNNTDLLWQNTQTGQVNVWLTNPASIGILSKGTLGTVADMNWEIQ